MGTGLRVLEDGFRRRTHGFRVARQVPYYIINQPALKRRVPNLHKSKFQRRVELLALASYHHVRDCNNKYLVFDQCQLHKSQFFAVVKLPWSTSSLERHEMVLRSWWPVDSVDQHPEGNSARVREWKRFEVAAEANILLGMYELYVPSWVLPILGGLCCSGAIGRLWQERIGYLRKRTKEPSYASPVSTEGVDNVEYAAQLPVFGFHRVGYAGLVGNAGQAASDTSICDVRQISTIATITFVDVISFASGFEYDAFADVIEISLANAVAH
ncbi:hypothetical protein SCHPADRAFT_895492 [Schizopora paradoxa]|uniref:Uncharacterized protein n=1 Tax=Schizopora paradoxa TaxID=27342 RepID=A0A0H2R4V7_9AGAM|nr:hypothetical protein SCHPADRAFT_895492 [Schizopora paradoxa]